MRRLGRFWIPGRYEPDGRSVAEAIERVRPAPVEVGYGFDIARRPRFVQVGDGSGIRGFRAVDLAAIRGGTFVHNHPPYPVPVGDPRRRAGSFSPRDLVFMYEHDLTEMVAATEERTYRLRRRPEGFYLDPGELRAEYRRLIAESELRLMEEVAQGRRDPREAKSEGLLADEVMDRLGLFYDYWIEEVERP